MQRGEHLGLRASAVLFTVAWFAIAAAGAAWIAFVQLQGDFYCPSPASDSVYGSLSWSVLPPGPVCTYTAVGGVETVDDPTAVMSVWLMTLAGLGYVLVSAVRGARRAGRR